MRSSLLTLLPLLITFYCLVMPEKAGAMDLTGQVIFLGSGSHRVNVEDTVIYFVPEGEYSKAKPGNYTQEMFRKRFTPRVLAIAPGSTITMPNKDTVKHNAFSTSEDNEFDLDLYGKGEEKSYTVKNPGIIRVYCNIHYSMISNILVLETPHVAMSDTVGKFSLLNLPNTKGKLHVWHEQANEQIFDIDPNIPSTIEDQTITMKSTRNRISKHLNKFGLSYRKYKN